MISEEEKLHFVAQVSPLEKESHGVAALVPLQGYFKDLPKIKRLAIIDEFFLREPIVWDSVKSNVWPDNLEAQEKNKFHLIQGDIVETNLVEGLGTALSATQHDTWLVLSPDCDCVRADLILLAPVFHIDSNVQNTTTKAAFSLAAGLSSMKYFPLGKDIFLSGNKEGCYADLQEPYFLRKNNKASATVHFSLKKQGWHILNALLKHKETRSIDIQEAIRIREMN